MAKGDKKAGDANRISEQERLRYIGFDVFPGKPKDLFKNDAEREQLIEKVRAKRESDSTLRDDCTLLEERVSMGEKIILAISSLAILAALFLPWYSAYTVVPAARQPAAATQPADTSMMATATGDTLAGPGDTATAPANEATDTVGGTNEAGDTAAVAATQGESPDIGVTTDEDLRIRSHQGQRSNEQIITAHAARERTIKEHSYLSGLGVFTALGSVGARVFSSGFILILTGILMLIYGILCVALPVINLYSIFGMKGKPDEIALKLKRHFKLNWLPLILFVVALILSFVGAEYGFDAEEMFTSLGDSYGVAVFIGSLSWGVFVSLAASLLVALKGIEI